MPEDSEPVLTTPTSNPNLLQNSPKLKLVIGAAVVIVLILAMGFFVLNKNQSSPATPSQATNQTIGSTSTNSGIDNSSLDSITQSASNDLNTLSIDESNADNGLNDQMADLTY